MGFDGVRNPQSLQRSLQRLFSGVVNIQSVGPSISETAGVYLMKHFIYLKYLTQQRTDGNKRERMDHGLRIAG